jgi:MFS family permease
VIAAADFLFVMDGLVVGVALPSIQAELGLGGSGLGWIINAYTIALGGFLLLGGRVGDVFGRRRAFDVGLLVFGAASLGAGLAPSTSVLVAARAAQGVGAATATAAAFSVLTALFEEGSERSRALGVLSVVGSLGVVAGAILGGVLTSFLGWRSVFLFNVPIVALALVLSRPIADSRDEAAPRRLDVAGAVCITAALTLLVGVIALLAHDVGVVVMVTLGVASLLLAALFVGVERRVAAPLVPADFARSSTAIRADVAALPLPLGLGTCLFAGTLYLQSVLGYDALAAGLTFLPLAIALTAASPVVTRAMRRWGARAVAAGGFATQSVGLVVVALSLTPAASIWEAIVPGFVIVGIGAVTAYIPVAERALEKVGTRAGLASGLFNTAQHIGNSLGIAALASVVALVAGETTAGSSGIAVTAQGLEAAFALGAGMLALASLLSLALLEGGVPSGGAGSTTRTAPPAPSRGAD